MMTTDEKLKLLATEVLTLGAQLDELTELVLVQFERGVARQEFEKENIMRAEIDQENARISDAKTRREALRKFFE
jgi:hypothetical protein